MITHLNTDSAIDIALELNGQWSDSKGKAWDVYFYSCHPLCCAKIVPDGMTSSESSSATKSVVYCLCNVTCVDCRMIVDGLLEFPIKNFFHFAAVVLDAYTQNMDKQLNHYRTRKLYTYPTR